MTATCPSNKNHRRFVTVAYVSQDWIVDEHGNFLEEKIGADQNVLHKPDPANCWSCAECGEQAIVTS